MPEDCATLLVRAGLVTHADVDAARDASARIGGTVPEHLVHAGAIDDEVLTEFFRTRLLVGRIDPNALVGLSAAVVDTVSRDLATSLRAMPVHIDDDGNVTVVLSDPTDDRAVQEIAHQCGIYVVRATATQRQLAWCLGNYHDFLTPLAETLLVEPEPAQVRERRRGVTNEVRAMRKAVLPPVAADGDDDADPTWIAERTEAMRREMAGMNASPQAMVDDTQATNKIPALKGEVHALDRSEVFPTESDDDELPTVLVDDDEQGSVTGLFVPEEADTKRPDSPRASGKRRVFVDAVDGDDETALPSGYVQRPPDLGRARPLTDEDLKPLVEELSAEMASAVSASESFDLRDTSRHVRPAAASSVADADSDLGTRTTTKVDMRNMGIPMAIDEQGTESRPFLLTRDAPDESGPVVLLEQRHRTARATAVGVGRAGRLTSHPPGATPPESQTDETRPANLPYTGDPQPGRPDAPTHTEPRSEPVSSKRKRKKRSRKDTSTPAEAQSRNLPRSTLSSEVDDGWGDEDFEIPVRRKAKPTEEVAAAPEPAEEKVADARGKPSGNNGESARSRRKTTPPTQADTELLTHTVKELGQTDDRNAVFDLLMDYLAGTHNRVAFFAVKKGKVCAWKHKGLDAGDGKAEVSLDSSTTFHSVVESQQPFHGEDVDEATHEFLTKATGNAPEDIIAAPVAIGPRVIGVLYGDAPHGTLFDQQVAMVTRTAGLALQRILQAAKK